MLRGSLGGPHIIALLAVLTLNSIIAGRLLI